MIALPFSDLPLVYAAILLGAVLLLWLGYDRRRERRRRRMLRTLCQCRLCAVWLRPDEKWRLFRCPSCGALNEMTRGSDL